MSDLLPSVLLQCAFNVLHCQRVVPFSQSGMGGANKSDEFLEKCQRGGGEFSIQKLILQILGTLVYFTFTLVFEHEIDKKKNHFRVQGMFFQQL